MKSMTKQMAIFLLGLVSITIFWYIGALLVDRAFLPTPVATYDGFFSLLENYDVKKHIFASLSRLLESLFLATLIGAPIGFLCGRFKTIDAILSPYITFLYPLPKIVFLPVLIVIFGLGNFSKIILITTIICFQILVIVRDTAKQLPQDWLLVMESLTKNPLSRLRHLYIPYILPSVITSLRISLGTAIAVLFFSETFIAVNGLGYLILDTMEMRNYAEMYAAIMILSAIGFVLYGILALIERYVSYQA